MQTLSTLVAAKAGLSEQEVNEYVNATLIRNAKEYALIESSIDAQYLEVIKTNPIALNKARAEIYAHFRALGIEIPTEAEMMYKIVNDSALKDSAHIKIESKKHVDGSRANTKDTIVDFELYYRETYPMACGLSVLVISTQPEAMYQIVPVKGVLTAAKGYTIDIAAEGIRDRLHTTSANDAIARRVYGLVKGS